MKIKNKYNSKEKIIKYSNNLLINLSDEEIELLISELDEVIEGLRDFYNIDERGLEPTNYIFNNINILRDDVLKLSNNKSDILECSKNWNGKYIKV